MTHEEEMAHWWVQTRFFYLNRALSFLKKESKLSVIEIGCGTAQNLHFLRQNQKWSPRIEKIVGIDTGLPTENVHAPWLQKKDSISKKIQPEDKNGSFDLLIAMDVLEHIEDDQTALREWIDLVRPGGWIFIAVPAFQILWSHHDEALQHKRRYQRENLQRLAEQTGLKTHWMSYAFSYIFPLVYLIRKFGQKKSGTALQPLSGWINWILTHLGKLECRIGGNRWIGTSVVAMLQKPHTPDVKAQTPPHTTRLSILIPAYNEEKRLPETLRKLKTFSDTLSSQESQIQLTEILVVNDGSKDRTDKIVQIYQDVLPTLRLISLPVNQGKGFAVRSGLMAAQGDYVLIADADMSTPWEDTLLLFDSLQNTGAQISIGSRGMEKSQLLVRQGILREVLGKSFNRLMRLIMGLPFKDTQCGFKLLEMNSVRPWLPLLQIKRFAWDVELLTLAAVNHLKVVEVPIHWEHRKDSHVRLLKDGSKMLIDLIWLRVRYFLFKSRYLKLIPNEVSVSHRDKAA